MHILASGPELQAVRFGCVTLGKKKLKSAQSILIHIEVAHFIVADNLHLRHVMLMSGED